MASSEYSALLALRRELHAMPELSGSEAKTAGIIKGFLDTCPPDELFDQLAGHGIGALYRGRVPGPRVMVRCDMDALPITERLDLAWRSKTDGASHKCGHDGHMSMVAGLARRFGRHRPEAGSVLLLFQPAEETGAGAAAVLQEPLFRDWPPDCVFGFHNLPGFARGQVILRRGVFASASRGLILDLQGATAHAGEPERGRSPALAVSALIQAFSGLAQFHVPLHEGAKVTVIHARLGERAFGTSPGVGQVMATLRSYSSDVMDTLVRRSRGLAEGIAAAHELALSLSWCEEFPVTRNDDNAVDVVASSAQKLGYPCVTPDHPFPWSEDFGHFTAAYGGAMFGLGAGLDHPPVHHPDYDFPDELIPIGVNLLDRIVVDALDRLPSPSAKTGS